jgi:WD40 repeat protein
LDRTGRRLAISSAGDTKVLVDDVETGQTIQSLTHPFGVHDMAWSDSGKLLATACANGSIYLWDATSGSLLRTFSGHESSAMEVRINHQGNLLASTGWDGHLRLWNLPTGGEICNWPFDHEQYSVVFSADDRWLQHCGWSTEYGLFEVEGASAADVLRFLGTGSNEVWQCSLTPDGKVLASMHGDRVLFWDVRAGTQIAVQAAKKVRSVTFDQTGRTLFVGCEEGLQEWNVEVKTENGAIALKVGSVRNLSDRPDLDRYSRPINPKAGMGALVSNGEIHLTDLATGRETARLGGAIRADYTCLSDDGRWCAASSFNDKVVTVFDLKASNSVHVVPAGLQNKTMSFSPGNRLLAVGDAKEYKFWDTASWKCVSTVSRAGSGGRSGAVSFSSDGKTAAVAYSSQSIRLVNVADGGELATLESSAPQEISWIEFDPDGSHLAVIGVGRNHYIQLWNIRSLRKELASMKLDW